MMRRRCGIAASCEVFGDTPKPPRATVGGVCVFGHSFLRAVAQKHCRSSCKNQAQSFIRMKLSGELGFSCGRGFFLGRTDMLCGFSAAPLPGTAFPTLLYELQKKPLQALSEYHAEHHEADESYRRSVNIDVDEHVAKIRDLWHNALA